MELKAFDTHHIKVRIVGKDKREILKGLVF